MLFVVEKWSELPFQYLSLPNFPGEHAPGLPKVRSPIGEQVANGHHCLGNPFRPDPTTPLSAVCRALRNFIDTSPLFPAHDIRLDTFSSKIVVASIPRFLAATFHVQNYWCRVQTHHPGFLSLLTQKKSLECHFLVLRPVKPCSGVPGIYLNADLTEDLLFLWQRLFCAAPRRHLCTKFAAAPRITVRSRTTRMRKDMLGDVAMVKKWRPQTSCTACSSKKTVGCEGLLRRSRKVCLLSSSWATITSPVYWPHVWTW